MPPWTLETFSSFGCGELGKLTSWWWGMRSLSYSNSCCSMSASNCCSACSISWEKSCSYDGSPYLNYAIWYDKSTTCTGDVSSISHVTSPYWIYFFYTSLYFLCNSYSFHSFSLSSGNSFSASSILLLSLCLCMILLSWCCLFASIAIVAFSTSGSTQNLQLFSFSMQSTIFLFHLFALVC